MPRPALLVLAWLALAAPALAAASGVLAVEGAPGARLSLDFTAPGAPGGPPVVLDVELKRPADTEQEGPLRWSLAALPGAPAQAVWEFAFPWEAQPGPWRLSVFQQGREVASALFDVTAPPQPPQAFDAGPDNAADAPPTAPAQPKRPDPGAPPAARAQPAEPSPSKLPPVKPAPQAVQPQASPTKPDSAVQAAPAAPRQPDAPKPAPRKRAVGGDPSRQVFALVAGSYSEEARALWVASFLRASGHEACVRRETLKGRQLWAVVAGWRDTRDEARQARDELAKATGDALVRPMKAGDLEKGLVCP